MSEAGGIGVLSAPGGFDFAAVLATVAHRRASDLHLTAGAHPMIREKGRVLPMEDFPN